jgi:hypothetical protein
LNFPTCFCHAANDTLVVASVSAYSTGGNAGCTGGRARRLISDALPSETVYQTRRTAPDGGSRFLRCLRINLNEYLTICSYDDILWR